jgi:hypothetical protein
MIVRLGETYGNSLSRLRAFVRRSLIILNMLPLVLQHDHET